MIYATRWRDYMRCLMSDEEKLHEWLRTCPFDWLMVGVVEGLRTVNFEIEETKDDEEI